VPNYVLTVDPNRFGLVKLDSNRPISGSLMPMAS